MGDDEVELQAAAVRAMATRFRTAGTTLARAREAHEDATRAPVEALAAAHTRVAQRWTQGLRVAAAALVEVGNELDACVRASSDRDAATAVEFRGIRP
ncbi:hypothetical protein [Cellulomonas palmilytica]|uniref:hypothetical protein n=1 Tax=Cellulomonas palmilytica TaxID=2608402 RepID=UPI001F3E03E6|nr:hypothetical protein [Cellulomonas palmilytica]UJP38629.1 hypothetical protein F1D97_09355 [Cellulomonas palmilytica]